MEPDRYSQNHFSYIMGLCCLITSLGLFAFSLYLFPNLVFGWRYDIPEFIGDFMNMLSDDYHLSKNMITWLIFIALDLPAVLLFIIADILSNKIDAQIYGIKKTSTKHPTQSVVDARNPDASEEEPKGLVFKIIMVIIVVFVVAEFFQWAIS